MKLTRSEKKWMESILDTLVPEGGDDRFPVSAMDTGAMKIFDEMLLYLPATTALGLRAAVWFVEFAGPAFGGKGLKRFSGLSMEGREQCLAKVSKSNVYLVRQMVLLHKSVAIFGWGGDERVHEAIGLNLPPKFVERSAGK